MFKQDILIDSIDDYFIVVSIPESEVESYQKRLDSDPEFRKNEIQQAQWAQQEREDWWKEAYKDIINGTILAVRYTIVQNTTEYPKVWRVFERI